MKNTARQGNVNFLTEFYGRSMHPTLKEGMLLLAKRISAAEARPGDILLYQNGNALIAHRLIRVLKQQGKTAFMTKGDNHAYVRSAPVPQEALRGRVEAAFYKHQPQKNVLIKNKIISSLYIAMANLASFMMRHKNFIPLFVRRALRPLVSVFFTAFKKTIHFIYLLFNI